jgi:hypothetical protein
MTDPLNNVAGFNTTYEVWLCGPTDCFWHATFVDAAKATEWALLNQQPEGYIIKEAQRVEDE